MKRSMVPSSAPVAGGRGFASNAEVAFGGAETVEEEFIDWIPVHRKLVKLDGIGKAFHLTAFFPLRKTPEKTPLFVYGASRDPRRSANRNGPTDPEWPVEEIVRRECATAAFWTDEAGDGAADRVKEWAGTEERVDASRVVVVGPAAPGRELTPADWCGIIDRAERDGGWIKLDPRGAKYEPFKVMVKSSLDGTMQPCYFGAPATTEPVPLLVQLHSWGSTSLSDAGWISGKAPYAVMVPHFRGPNARPEACGSDLGVQDVVDAVEYAKAHANIDPNRIYVAGGSGGAHMTLMMIGRHPEIWAGAIAFCPITDLARWHGESLEEHPGRNKVYAQMLEIACGGRPGDGRHGEYWRRSPLACLEAARKAGVPLYLACGIHDGWTGAVPVGHSIRAYNALANAKDRLSEEDIAQIERTRQVPEALALKEPDPFYPEKLKIHLRRTSANVRFTIFEAGHDCNYPAGHDFLFRQRKDEKADFTLPDRGEGGRTVISK